MPHSNCTLLFSLRRVIVFKLLGPGLALQLAELPFVVSALVSVVTGFSSPKGVGVLELKAA